MVLHQAPKILVLSLLPFCYPYTDAFVTSVLPGHMRNDIHHKLQFARCSRSGHVSCRQTRFDGSGLDKAQDVEAVAGSASSDYPPYAELSEVETVQVAKLRLQIQEAVKMEDFLSAANYQAQLKNLERKATKLQFDYYTGELAIREPSTPARVSPEPMVINVLLEEERARNDEADDAIFYSKPRMALHTDMPFAFRLQQLYTERLGAARSILDLGASCATFLPEGASFDRVVGLGMNMEEMMANEELSARIVKDLNACSLLPFADNEFDAVLCASTLHYFRQPEAILTEVQRVLKPGGVLIVSFSDRFFDSKAIEGWRRRGSIARCDLIADCLAAAGGMTPAERVLRFNTLSPLSHLIPQLRPLCGGDPFAALVAYKGVPPAGWAVRLHGPAPLRIPMLNMTVAPLHLTPFAAVYLLYSIFHML